MSAQKTLIGLHERVLRTRIKKYKGLTSLTVTATHLTLD